MSKEKRAAIYLRVSTGEQTVDNQRRELEAAAGPADHSRGVRALRGSVPLSGLSGCS